MDPVEVYEVHLEKLRIFKNDLESTLTKYLEEQNVGRKQSDAKRHTKNKSKAVAAVTDNVTPSVTHNIMPSLGDNDIEDVLSSMHHAGGIAPPQTLESSTELGFLETLSTAEVKKTAVIEGMEGLDFNSPTKERMHIFSPTHAEMTKMVSPLDPFAASLDFQLDLASSSLVGGDDVTVTDDNAGGTGWLDDNLADMGVFSEEGLQRPVIDESSTESVGFGVVSAEDEVAAVGYLKTLSGNPFEEMMSTKEISELEVPSTDMTHSFTTMTTPITTITQPALDMTHPTREISHVPSSEVAPDDALGFGANIPYTDPRPISFDVTPLSGVPDPTESFIPFEVGTSEAAGKLTGMFDEPAIRATSSTMGSTVAAAICGDSDTDTALRAILNNEGEDDDFGDFIESFEVPSSAAAAPPDTRSDAELLAAAAAISNDTWDTDSMMMWREKVESKPPPLSAPTAAAASSGNISLGKENSIAGSREEFGLDLFPLAVGPLSADTPPPPVSTAVPAAVDDEDEWDDYQESKLDAFADVAPVTGKSEAVDFGWDSLAPISHMPDHDTKEAVTKQVMSTQDPVVGVGMTSVSNLNNGSMTNLDGGKEVGFAFDFGMGYGGGKHTMLTMNDSSNGTNDNTHVAKGGLGVIDDEFLFGPGGVGVGDNEDTTFAELDLRPLDRFHNANVLDPAETYISNGVNDTSANSSHPVDDEDDFDDFVDSSWVSAPPDTSIDALNTLNPINRSVSDTTSDAKNPTENPNLRGRINSEIPDLSFMMAKHVV